jgi:hypothetical protein
MSGRALALLTTLALVACVEEISAPGSCPDYCPDHLNVIDTIMRSAIDGDSAFRGYTRPHDALELLAADHPEVQSRALWQTAGIPHRYAVGADSTTSPIAAVDSLRVEIAVPRHDTTPTNLRLHLYRMPKTLDSTTTYADVLPAFTDSLVRSVNLDSLLALPPVRDTVLDTNVRRDTVTGDYIRVDVISGYTVLSMKLDSADAPYVPAESGVLALGMRVSGDGPASAAFGTEEDGAALFVTWYVRVDSAGLALVPPRNSPIAITEFDTFVFDPPPPPTDSTLVVGGMPLARSVLRVHLPPGIRDSGQVVRGTLLLVPDRPAQGVPADSFVVIARRAVSDLGARSALAPVPRSQADSSHAGAAWVRIGSTDTIRIEITAILRQWAIDTSAPRTIVLQQSIRANVIDEGKSLSEIRFKPSSDGAFRPALRVTYAPRYRFDIP